MQAALVSGVPASRPGIWYWVLQRLFAREDVMLTSQLILVQRQGLQACQA